MPLAPTHFGDRLAGPLLFGGALAASWVFLLQGAGTGMNVAAMSTWQVPPPLDRPARAVPWGIAHAATMTLMWWIMMLAMMLPGVAASAWRRAPVGLRFFLGYGAGWLAFSVAAAALQAALERAGLVDAMMMWSASAGFSSLLLAAVGLYQLSAAKTRNLARCRTSADTRLTDGLHHAVRCMVNSAPLMSLLFVGGVMNLYWIVALSAINLAERGIASPRWFSKGVGIVCVVAAAMVAGTGSGKP